ncbi:hypothetical protein C4D60_Mb05t20030 [Musa balbisiana]|uniref:Nucleotide-diphospho-sugar transferase domain-containing protein n=1 Tax=Musa balbisiana TaxID=52838 RepID=A0A4S8JXH9_MUSBA|nr:hypothetical protein C4D60_Mb05t20030 [Musa balbisiana]
MIAMGFSGAISYRATAFIVAPLLVLVVIYGCLWSPGVPTAFFRLQNGANTTEITPKDELETALEGVAMENRTLVIAILNKAYVEQNAMLDLFLQSLGGGEDTEFLIDHLLFVADMDVMWLRNPFSQLYRDGEDLQMSSDFYYGKPFDNSNFNTGFYFVTANNKTVALFDEWYAWRNNSKGMKDQDVLQKMKKEGAFTRLGLKVRYLETTYFSGFCQMSQDLRKVITVHANCCVSMKVKLIDLRSVLEAWKVSNSNGTSNATTAWPPVKGICLHDTASKHTATKH